MDCQNTRTLTTREYLTEFNKRSAQLQIPLSGSIELTRRCNLRCIHCYLGHREGEVSQAETGTPRMLSLVDEITEAGCLYLLITGGEPLVRKDFPEIYGHAREKGLIITVFTNGTLITDDILGLFHELPPRAVEISVYGATRATYESITGVQGSYGKCMRGIRKLLERGTNVRLKTILMTSNAHEFSAMEDMAGELGVPFRFDAALFPRLDGDRSPLQFRVAAEEAVEKEFSDRKRSEQWKDFFERFRGKELSDRLFQCGAGTTSFHVDSFGNLLPCLMTRTISRQLHPDRFPDAWKTVASEIKQRTSEDSFECRKCEKIHLCGFCPSFFEMETGSESIPSEYLCEMGRLRHNYLNVIKGNR